MSTNRPSTVARSAIPSPIPARRCRRHLLARLRLRQGRLASTWGPRGQIPADIGGLFYSTGLTILLTIVTLGIWAFVWTHGMSEDLKRYNGDGLGGVLGIVILLHVSPMQMITIPNEIKNMYRRDGRQSPVSAIW